MTEKLLDRNAYGEVLQRAHSHDVDIINIKHQHCNARISLYGGQILHWQPQDQRPVFWLSDSSSYGSGSAIRGGVPLCWPWFGPYSQDGIKGGNHGFARNEPWHIENIAIDEGAVTIVLAYGDENKSALWPHAFKLQQVITLGEQLEQRLIMHNLSNENVKYSSALHSYFLVSSPKNVQVNALSNIPFFDKINNVEHQGDILNDCRGPLDRIYQSSRKVVLEDKTWQRSIELLSTNCQHWVLWNPGIDVADNMADIHSAGEQEFVCLEPANCQWQQIPVNSSSEVAQKIVVINH